MQYNIVGGIYMFFVIRLKKFLLICIVLMIGLFTYFGGQIQNNFTVSTISNFDIKTVIVDAGHGEPDGGCESNDGVKESYLNLQVALELEELLKQMGYKVIMTRKDENNIGDSDKQTSIRQKKVSDINNRIKIVNESEADFLISIHMNKFSETKYYGWQTFYKSGSEESKTLAETIQQGLSGKIDRVNKRTPLSIRGIKFIDNSKIPSIIVECGFLSNNEDLRLLQAPEYRENIAYGILDGIEEYYEIKGK
jgi:N-acetylmuramoyl-L-alanine amidase